MQFGGRVPSFGTNHQCQRSGYGRPNMRVLKTIIIIIVALLGLWLIISLFAPSKTDVERSTVIKASPETIYSYISHLKNMDDWGVWRKMDKDAKYEYTGEDGTVGFRESWDGDTVMQGSMTITGLEPNKSMKSDLAFGDFMVSKVSMDLAPVDGGTEVKWSLKNEIPFTWRAMMMFMGMGSSVEKDFDNGLASLKEITEALQEAADKENAAPKTEVQIGDRPAATYVGIKSSPKLPMAEMDKFFMDNAPKLFEALGKANVQPMGPMCGLYFDWNEKEQTTSLMVCAPVAEGTKVKGLETEKMPAGKAYWVELKGPYSGMKPAHDAIGARIEADSMDYAGPVLEEYLVAPGQEKDSTKYVTNIIYLVKARK